jgi:hypothetical protein
LHISQWASEDVAGFSPVGVELPCFQKAMIETEHMARKAKRMTRRKDKQKVSKNGNGQQRTEMECKKTRKGRKAIKLSENMDNQMKKTREANAMASQKAREKATKNIK